jgi:uncharacterized membrane protein YgdD (TMEM256/DUF423 family)
MKERSTLLWGATFGLLAVALGAFGAHALRDLLHANGKTDTFELAVRYQFYHALALMVNGLFQRQFFGQGRSSRSAVFFVAGVLFFSGSLYALALTGFRPMAWLTPVGGVALLAGWLIFLRDIIRSTGAK